MVFLLLMSGNLEHNCHHIPKHHYCWTISFTDGILKAVRRPINISSLVYKLMSSVGNGPLACKLKYVRNVGDVTSGGRSATILYTDKTGVLFVGYSRVPESCSLPRVCEQGVRVLTLRLAFETSESTVARVNTKKVARRHLNPMWQQAIAPPQCFLSSLFERPK